MPAVQRSKVTVQQYLQMGEDPPGLRFELVDGELEVSPSPNPAHAYTVSELHGTLRQIAAEDQHRGVVLMDLDTQVADATMRRPDLLYFSQSRRHLIGRDRLSGVPDLAVEVVSPASGSLDRDTKFREYADAGIMNYWIIDPSQRSFAAYRLSSGEYRQTVRGQHQQTVKAEPFAETPLFLGPLWLD